MNAWDLSKSRIPALINTSIGVRRAFAILRTAARLCHPIKNRLILESLAGSGRQGPGTGKELTYLIVLDFIG